MQTTSLKSNAKAAAPSTFRLAASSPLVIALGALLVLQLLAALLPGLRGMDTEPTSNAGPLVDFKREQVSSIRIQVPDEEPVLLAKTESGWTLPALGDLPASVPKVTELLTKLDGLRKGLPVATSAQALKRFKVAEDDFERKLTLEAGDNTLGTLYLGDSAGFRRLFVRANGDGSIYEAEIGLFDVSNKPEDWSDRTLLHLDAQEIKELSVGHLVLEQTEDGWRLADLAEGEEPDAQAIEDWVRRLTNIDFLGIAAGDDSPAIVQEPPPVEIVSALKSGDRIEYRISKLDEGDDYLLEASNRPQGFRLAAYTAEDLAGLSRAQLFKETVPTQEGEPASEIEPPAHAADAKEPAAKQTSGADTRVPAP